VRDGEAGGGLGLVLARVQLVLQITVVQLIDEVVWTGAQLHKEAVACAIVFRWAAVVLPGLRRLGA